MAFEPIIGQTARATWTADGGGVETDLRNEKWSLTISRPTIEIPNTTDGMFREVGLEDCEASVEGPWNDDVPITDICKPGDRGVLKLYLASGGKFYSFNAIIGEDMEIETEFDEPVTWSFDASLGSGVLTYPV